MATDRNAATNVKTVQAHGLPYDEQHYYKGERTLVNKLDIHDQELLRDVENRMVRERSAEMRANPVSTTFDVAHYKEIHKQLFGGLYHWAGQFSDWQQKLFDQTRDPKFPDGTTWKEDVEKMFVDMREDVLRPGQSKEQHISALIDSTLDFQSWMPFPRGNDRTAQVYVAQLARAAGLEFDMSRFGKESWHEAFDLASFRPSDGEPTSYYNITKLVRASTRPLRAAAFSEAMASGDRQGAIQRFPELENVFTAMDEVHIRYGGSRQEMFQAGDQMDWKTVRSIQTSLDAGMDPGKMEEHRLQQWVMALGRGHSR